MTKRPDLPGEEGIAPGEDAFWGLLFLALGTLILANHPGREGWPFIVIAVVSYAAAAVFLFRLLVRRN